MDEHNQYNFLSRHKLVNGTDPHNGVNIELLPKYSERVSKIKHQLI